MTSSMTAKYIYRLCTEPRTDESGATILVYGIDVCASGTDTPLISLHDLFTCEKKARELTELCNKLELDPIHLTAVVEDALIAF